MKRAIVAAIVAGPLLMVAAGIYILVGTPNIVTEYTTYSSSHGWGVILVMLGGVLGLVAGMVASIAFDS
jgi:hypothetical protein